MIYVCNEEKCTVDCHHKGIHRHYKTLGRHITGCQGNWPLSEGEEFPEQRCLCLDNGHPDYCEAMKILGREPLEGSRCC